MLNQVPCQSWIVDVCNFNVWQQPKVSLMQSHPGVALRCTPTAALYITVPLWRELCSGISV